MTTSSSQVYSTGVVVGVYTSFKFYETQNPTFQSFVTSFIPTIHYSLSYSTFTQSTTLSRCHDDDESSPVSVDRRKKMHWDNEFSSADRTLRRHGSEQSIDARLVLLPFAHFGAEEESMFSDRVVNWTADLSKFSAERKLHDMHLILFDSHKRELAKKFLSLQPTSMVLLESDGLMASNQKVSERDPIPCDWIQDQCVSAVRQTLSLGSAGEWGQQCRGDSGSAMQVGGLSRQSEGSVGA